jgi:tetratricopeptide (TPR) repeat protein
VVAGGVAAGLSAASRTRRLDPHREAYERASREDPKDATAYINLAAIYAKLGDRDRSQRNLQEGCGLDPRLCRRMASKPH